MDSILSALRQVIGEPDFYHKLGNSTSYSWDYGAMIEYLVASLILICVVCNVFKFLRYFLKR